MKMEQEKPLEIDDRTHRAIAELESIITLNFPSATYSLVRAADEPGSLNLIAAVDVEDPDDVLDKVIGRVLDLTVDEGIPLHVVPVRTPKRRDLAKRALQRDHRRARPLAVTRLGLVDELGR